MSDLAIPDFLRRERCALTQVTVSHKRPQRRFKRLRVPGRPAGERWADATLRDVWLYDEAPTIGCGRRRLWVSEGRKWCKLAGTDGSKAKISMAVWKEIARRMP